jgi:hypothetical protein
MCSSLFLLALGSHDLSQAEKRMTIIVKSSKLNKLHTKLSMMNKVVILSEKSCHFE